MKVIFIQLQLLDYSDCQNSNFNRHLESGIQTPNFYIRDGGR